MVMVVLALTVGATRRGMPVLASLIIPPVLASWFAWDWSKTDDSGLYAVGVLALLVGSLLGVGFVAVLARSFFASEAQIDSQAAPG